MLGMGCQILETQAPHLSTAARGMQRAAVYPTSFRVCPKRLFMGAGARYSRYPGFEVSVRNKLLSAGALFLLLCPWLMAATKPGLPFIENDYAKALNEAKQKNLPLFVEVSAPW